MYLVVSFRSSAWAVSSARERLPSQSVSWHAGLSPAKCPEFSYAPVPPPAQVKASGGGAGHWRPSKCRHSATEGQAISESGIEPRMLRHCRCAHCHCQRLLPSEGRSQCPLKVHGRRGVVLATTASDTAVGPWQIRHHGTIMMFNVSGPLPCDNPAHLSGSLLLGPEY